MSYCSENSVLQVLRMGGAVLSGAEWGRRGAVERFERVLEDSTSVVEDY